MDQLAREYPHPILRVAPEPDASGTLFYLHGLCPLHPHLPDAQYWLCEEHISSFPQNGARINLVYGELKCINEASSWDMLQQGLDVSSLPSMPSERESDKMPLILNNFLVWLAMKRPSTEPNGKIKLVEIEHDIFICPLRGQIWHSQAPAPAWALPPGDILWPMIVAHRDRAMERRVEGLLGRTKSKLRADAAARPFD